MEVGFDNPKLDLWLEKEGELYRSWQLIWELKADQVIQLPGNVPVNSLVHRKVSSNTSFGAM